MMNAKKHVLAILVDNQPGVLSRVVGLFTGRGYNIESLCVAATHDPSVSRITLVTNANAPLIEQIAKQLRKLINVVKVSDLTGAEAVKREMVLLRVRARRENRSEILRLVDIFNCRVVDVGTDNYVIEATGDEEKLGALLGLLKPLGIREIARTGTIALLREPKS